MAPTQKSKIFGATKHTTVPTHRGEKCFAGYDIIGNIVIVKFDYAASAREKKAFALDFLKKHAQVTTVVEKVGKFSGRLRTQATKHVAGEKTKEALCKENSCVFRLNVDTCYFSPRLSSERKELAEMVKKGERVLIMCGGIAPYAIVIAKLSKASEIVSVELGRECTKYAQINVKRNKVQDRVTIVGGDVRKKVPQLDGLFDRIILARPQLTDSFLDTAFAKLKPKGTIHYYGFYHETEEDELQTLLREEAKKAGRTIKIVKTKKAGNIGTGRFRFRADCKVS